MSFQKLDFSNVEKPEVHREKLPEYRSFPSLEEAFRAYLPWFQNPNIEPVQPWVRPPDATRLINRTLEQFATDWPQIFDKASEEERLLCVLAYIHLQGILLGWMFADETMGGDGADAGENKLLQDALVTRNQLLALADIAYEGKAEIEKQIQHIRSATEKSRYDELTKDLTATIALFESNRFTSLGEVLFPESRLKKAVELASKLPLFSPRNSGLAVPGVKDVPMNHRAFSVMVSAMYQLSGWGRFVHFPKDGSVLYPLRVPTSKSNVTSSAPSNPEDGTIPNTIANTIVNFGS